MKKVITILCLFFLIFGCSKSSNDGGDLGENPDGEGNQGINRIGVKLYFPQENMLCNLGEDITPTHSTVYFEWEANGSDNYKITVENLSNGNIIQDETVADIIPVILDRATPYSWYIESVSSSKTEKSEVWQFYNAGPGVQSYAPFPAVIEAPLMATSFPSGTTTVTLKWTGNDVDDDIVGYDVHFGTAENPNAHSSDITTTEVSVSVFSGTIYYWKVITKDSFGNTSDSGIFQFKVL
ncbi:hypothetical protein WJN01_12130 [Flavobacteriaceae bacterium SZ-1-7]|uniref:hypothetical protein n=1 Tax=Tamlana sedimenti TaxID=3134126 RepID=UPI003122071D